MVVAPQIELQERIHAGTADELAQADRMGLPPSLYGYKYITIFPYVHDIILEKIKRIDKDHSMIYFRLGGFAVVKYDADELAVKINDLQNNDVE